MTDSLNRNISYMQDNSRFNFRVDFMQEALKALIQMGWNVMNLDWAEATVEQGNIQSQRLLDKLNFVKSDELKEGLFYYTLHRT